MRSWMVRMVAYQRVAGRARARDRNQPRRLFPAGGACSHLGPRPARRVVTLMQPALGLVLHGDEIKAISSSAYLPTLAMGTSPCLHARHATPPLPTPHAGSQLDVPASVTPMQLEALLNGLLSNDEKLPYSFHIEEQELGGELGLHLQKHSISVEKALTVVYQPQAIFRVRGEEGAGGVNAAGSSMSSAERGEASWSQAVLNGFCMERTGLSPEPSPTQPPPLFLSRSGRWPGALPRCPGTAKRSSLSISALTGDSSQAGAGTRP
jgi:hypothetical protein